MCVTQERIAAAGNREVGSGQTPAIVGFVDTTLITPVVSVTPVNGLPVTSLLIESVRRPSGVRRQLQHSLISCSGSNTKMLAQILPPAYVPGSVRRRVPSGAPAVLALAK